MKYVLSSIIFVVAIAAAGLYVAENYVLMGRILYAGYAAPTENIPSPTIMIPVPEGAEEVTVYMSSHQDWDIAYRVSDPYGDVVVEDEVSLGRDTLPFAAGEEGTYQFRIQVPSGNYPQGRVDVEAWADDSRMFAGCF